MTRFARAKGSKSSNERIPHEPTPWNVLKQQLEGALEKEETQKKTKSAKELLKEKELYYSDTVGNVNNDWAEFDNSKPKTNNVKKGKVEKKPKEKKKKLKEAIDKTEGKLEEVTDKSSDKIENTAKPFKNKDKLKQKQHKLKKNVPEAVGDNSPIPEVEDKKDNLDKKRKNKQNYNTTINDDAKQFKNKKRKLKSENETEPIEKSENATLDKSENNAESNKLSKRQKRNQKKQNQKSEEKNLENTFNVEGNDWNASVKFDKEKKFNGNGDGNGRPNKFQRRPWIEDPLDYKNFKRFGNNVPKKFQRKVAKPRDEREHRQQKFENPTKVTINGMEVEIVKYDGYPIKKDDAERLIALRKEMVLKGIPKPDIDAAMKLERRKCEKALARIRKQVCFHCRKAGHNLSDCPELGREEAGTGICFKCGSTEHTHFECKVNKSDDYRYAKCFICREQGHIAKQCPDNPKGLYPDGGSCKICGEVTHLKKDCPDLIKEKEEKSVTLDTINDNNLEALEEECSKVNRINKPTVKKIITF